MKWRIVVVCLTTLAFFAAIPAWASANASSPGQRNLEPLRVNHRQVQPEDQQKDKRNQEEQKAEREKNKPNNAEHSKVRTNNQHPTVKTREHTKTNEQPKRQEHPSKDTGKVTVKHDEHHDQPRHEEKRQVESPRDHRPDTRNVWKDRSDHWRSHWPEQRGWEHNFHDWNWYSRFRVDNVHAYYSNRQHDRVVYMNFEPESRYFDEMSARYGHYNYQERIYRWGGYGNCYHWFRNHEVYSVFVRDDGYVRSFIWHRHETDEEALALGLLNLAFLSSLNQYDDDMPENLAALYVANVLWMMATDD